jgi:hypothetical protein
VLIRIGLAHHYTQEEFDTQKEYQTSGYCGPGQKQVAVSAY